MTESKAVSFKVTNIVYVGLFAVLIVLCSWISVPTSIPFTMQTFAVFCAVGLLGGKRGTLSVLVYILLGVIGVPVFSGFSGGIGILLGNTGGYIIGFIFSALIYWGMTVLLGKKTIIMVLAMLLGLLACYAFGTAWFMVVYMKNTGTVGLMTALGWCVFPYILPDLIKIALAVLITKRLSRHVKL